MFSGIVDVSTTREITLGHAALLLAESYLFVPRKDFGKADEDAARWRRIQCLAQSEYTSRKLPQ
jgi:hypothetical protein